MNPILRNNRTNPKATCATHGPSQAPLLDRELQKPRSKEIIQTISATLNDLASEKQCTRCTVKSISILLTGHVREMREAKRTGEWSKEDKKALKAEARAMFKPVKKDIKALWKAN